MRKEPLSSAELVRANPDVTIAVAEEFALYIRNNTRGWEIEFIASFTVTVANLFMNICPHEFDRGQFYASCQRKLGEAK